MNDNDMVRRAGLMPDRRPRVKATRRVPLTTNQHILHLLVTVFTCGLWAPIWIIRALDGNRVPNE
jgi:hypothetical protein